MVRKRLNGDERLCRVVSVKLTPPDHATWLAKVEASGLSSSEFFRKAVLANQTTIIPVPQVNGHLVRHLRLYAGLCAVTEAILVRAVRDRDRGVLGAQDYRLLLSRLSAVMSAFKEGPRNAD